MRKFCLWFFLALCAVIPCMGQQLVRLRLQPIDFDDTGAMDAYPRSIHQIESVGEKIFSRGFKDPYVTIMDRTGRILGKVGSRGAGPGEIQYGVLAIGVWEDNIWVQGADQRKRLHHFLDGKYQNKIELHPHHFSVFSDNSNAFAVSKDYVIYPVNPNTGHLGQVYNTGGTFKKMIGELHFDERDKHLVKNNPAMNDTNWLYEAPDYYCVFRFFPLVLKFNAALEKSGGFQINNAIMDELYQEKVEENETARQRGVLHPLFSGVEIKKGNLFLMAPPSLFQIDLATQKILYIYRFYGEKGAFKRLKNEGRNLYLWHFTVLDDGMLILSGAFMWDHDLWYAKIKPF